VISGSFAVRPVPGRTRRRTRPWRALYTTCVDSRASFLADCLDVRKSCSTLRIQEVTEAGPSADQRRPELGAEQFAQPVHRLADIVRMNPRASRP
jgi:hypothetical protein